MELFVQIIQALLTEWEETYMVETGMLTEIELLSGLYPDECWIHVRPDQWCYAHAWYIGGKWSISTYAYDEADEQELAAHGKAYRA